MPSKHNKKSDKKGSSIKKSYGEAVERPPVKPPKLKPNKSEKI
ncbi:hypothetical protein [Gracilibacillus caseinilyticus]|nr:hypothetical protein [Gracilibacillus caseinilyticus]